MPGAEMDDLDNAHLLAEGIIDRAEAKEAAERKRKVRYVFNILQIFKRFSASYSPTHFSARLLTFMRLLLYADGD